MALSRVKDWKVHFKLKEFKKMFNLLIICFVKLKNVSGSVDEEERMVKGETGGW